MKIARIVSLAGAAAVWVATLLPGLHPTAQAAEAADGKTVFLAQKCNLCHGVSSAGIEGRSQSESTKGPDLSTVDLSKLDDAAIGRYLRKQEKLNDKLHKKEFKGTDDDLAAVILWLREQKP